jgi:hypothetical protein
MRASIMNKNIQTPECLRSAKYAGSSRFDLGTGGVMRT